MYLLVTEDAGDFDSGEDIILVFRGAVHLRAGDDRRQHQRRDTARKRPNVVCLVIFSKVVHFPSDNARRECQSQNKAKGTENEDHYDKTEVYDIVVVVVVVVAFPCMFGDRSTGAWPSPIYSYFQRTEKQRQQQQQQKQRKQPQRQHNNNRKMEHTAGHIPSSHSSS